MPKSCHQGPKCKPAASNDSSLCAKRRRALRRRIGRSLTGLFDLDRWRVRIDVGRDLAVGAAPMASDVGHGTIGEGDHLVACIALQAARSTAGDILALHPIAELGPWNLAS